jgi:hypothetical protein
MIFILLGFVIIQNSMDTHFKKMPIEPMTLGDLNYLNSIVEKG